ncbi:AAA family ATPase [Bradyrhizobium sp. JYMT SZCCT0428]|uniref:AAA family ATPase n=1 Tax=Bradyrhizobium sp. JYMT SZCCT0428 TaxID=2807673 RepID=UPI0039089FF6
MNSADIPLAHKHRPTRFDRLSGQDRAVAILAGFVRARAPIHVLLYGAYGAGKSTLAGLYARALHCKRPDVDGSPCNSCSHCSDPRNFLEFDVPKEGDSPGYLLELINLRMQNCTDRPVIFLDEAHALHESDADALLKRFEAVPCSATYILATTAPWEISSALRSRLHRVEVQVLSPWDSVRFLEEVAEAEGLDLDERALRLIAALSKGHPRDLLTNLDTVVDRRSGSHQQITDAQVRARLGLASDDFLLSYFRALVNEGADAATAILHDWPASWSSKSRWVQAFLLLWSKRCATSTHMLIHW